MRKNYVKRIFSGVLAAVMCLLPAVSNVLPANAESQIQYTVTAETIDHGWVELNNSAETPLAVDSDSEVTIAVNPDAGYEVDSVSAVKTDGSENEVTNDNGIYQTMVTDSNISIHVSIVEKQETEKVEAKISAEDVDESLLCEDENCLIEHVGHTLDPQDVMTDVLTANKTKSLLKRSISTLASSPEPYVGMTASGVNADITFMGGDPSTPGLFDVNFNDGTLAGTYVSGFECINHGAANPGVDGPVQSTYTATVIGVNKDTGIVTWSVVVTPPDACEEGTVNGYQRIGGVMTTIYNFVKTGYAKVVKTSSNPDLTNGNNCYSFAGAQYTIYNKGTNTVVAVLTLNASGISNTAEINAGTYDILETKGPDNESYAVDTSRHSITVTKGKTTTFNTTDVPGNDPGVIILGKTDKETNANKPAGSASLAGAEYTVKYYGGHYSTESELGKIVPLKTWIYKTDENGGIRLQNTDKYLVSGDTPYYEDGKFTLPMGTLRIQETKAPTGYNISNTVYIIPVTASGTGAVIDYNTPTVPEQVIRGGVKIAKVDSDTDQNKAQGNASLSGAVFEIKNLSDGDVTVDGNTYAKGQVCKTLTTDANGLAATAANTLPYGHYSMAEKTASKGYKLTSEVKEFNISEEGMIVDLTGSGFHEPVIRGGVQIQKFDKELDVSEAIGGNNHDKNDTGTTLSGIDFVIVNKSAHDVLVDGKQYSPGEKVAAITTHWNDAVKAYTAETKDSALPYGTYTMQESKTNDSYLLTDGIARTFSIIENGKVVTSDVNVNSLTFKNQVKRGDFKLTKIADETSKRLSVPFAITNQATGETHVVVSDRNGEFSSEFKWNAHSADTNDNDRLLDMEKTNETIMPDDMNPMAGIWFGTGESGSTAAVDDTLGALPYGKYTLRELPCDNNVGYVMQKFDFYIYRDSTTVDLDTITNDAGVPEIETTALDKGTVNHLSQADDDVTIIDKVHLTGLLKGEEYTLKGTLTDESDEGTVLKADGRKIKATKTFKATGLTMDVEMEFTFNGSKFAGKTAVVYESLEYNKKVRAVHEDVDDEYQTIYFPKIATTAIDAETAKHIGKADNEMTLVDTVMYDNLLPGEEYTVVGTLMDQDSKKPIQINGEELTATITFTADTASGSADVTFTFDASSFAGKTVVAYEKLMYLGTTVAEHADISDKGQSVQIPKIETAANDAETKIPVSKADGKVSIVDTVKYENLSTDYDYTVNGTLMDKESGEVFMDASGNPVTATAELKPTKSDGTVDVTFTFDGTGLENRSLVVFENMSCGDLSVASHEDINDADQTVYFPVIQTEALDADTGIHLSRNDKKTTVIDTVSFQNLKPGFEYTVKGTLMDKSTGKEILVDNKKVTGTTKFTPTKESGIAQVQFEFDSTSLGGRDLVAFESLYYKDALIAEHNDPTDAKQAVQIPKIGTTLISNDTNDHVSGTGERVILTDSVKYENLLPGLDYTLNGKLVNKKTGEEILGADKKPVTSETNFTASESSGEIEMTFNLNASDLTGATVVAYEDLSFNGKTIVSHADVNDESQSVHIPEIKTSAVDKDTNTKVSKLDKKATIVDTVSYANLVPGKEYTLKGTLMDKASGKALTESGSRFEESLTCQFTAGTYAATVKDNIMDVYVLEDSKYVNVSDNTDMLGKLPTEAFKFNVETDGTYTIGKTAGGSNELAPEEELYAESHPLTTYLAFTPEKASGKIDLEFTADTTLLAGKTTVVFEDLYFGDVKVGAHSDLKDAAQSVYTPAIKTTATAKDFDSHETTAIQDITITDAVVYSNLVPGIEYTVKGRLMDKSTGDVLKTDEKDITAVQKFTPTESSGKVMLEFKFDGSNLANKELVAFEDLYSDDVLVGTHSDLNDADQTVKVVKENEIVQTNDNFNVKLLIIGGTTAVLLFGMGIILMKKKRK